MVGKLMIGVVLTPKAQADADAKNIRSSAAVAVVVATRNDKTAWLEVGRAYERLALQAAALDIRSAFINQPIEVRPLRPQFESWLGLSDEHALLLVRIGRAPLAPFSLRRPIDDVMVSRMPHERLGVSREMDRYRTWGQRAGMHSIVSSRRSTL